MKHTLFAICFTLGLGLTPAHAEEPGHSAVNAQPRGEDWWSNRAGKLNQSVQDTPDTKLVFIGDSITQGWEGAGAGIWAERYARFQAVNLGIGGDRTQHVLWRLDHGNLNGIAPEAAVVMIGTNNSNGIDNTAGQIIEGVTAIVDKLRTKVPETKVLLLGIFPRGENINPQRGKLLQINQVLARLHDGEHIRYLDIGHHFLNGEGLIPQDIMPDFLHLSEKGYAIWADAIAPVLSDWLGESDPVTATVAGKWVFTIRGPNDEDVDMPLELGVSAGKLTGRIGRGDSGEWLELEDGKVHGDTVQFTVKRDRPGGGIMIYRMEGSLQDGMLSGKVAAETEDGITERDWRARRSE